MKNKKTVIVLVFLITILAIVATSFGIFTNDIKGLEKITSVNGQEIELYGKGIYHNMSSDVAVQGIGQDYVTLFIGIPALIISLLISIKGSIKGKYILSGVLFYLFINYLFYTIMAMYNELFLIYVSLMGLTFFALATVLFSFDIPKLPDKFKHKVPNKLTGIFLIINTLMIAMLWFQVVIPPLVDGTIIPEQVQHYTTLIVQGMDLGLLLPLAFVSGIFFIKKKTIGYLMGPVYIVFLSFQMTALLGKIIAMSLVGVSAGPALIVIPSLLLISIVSATLTIKSIK